MAERYARMEGDTVAEVFDFRPMLHASLEVIEVSPEVEPNWRREDGAFLPPATVVIDPGSPVPVITYKADIYRRTTEEEAEAIEMALAAAPVRQRRLFESALHLDHSDEAFAFAQEALVGMFGKKRAGELLAAS
ncbi:hypothetical protein [Methylorubrum extorquens]|uniref:Uncharacterized protein n=1 Tax=Methylorubrum extorquens DSM 13060 TaxID=882800 RepID=H1KC49_METEX|nr:hypothetical protein [Methylorubrum extorquens]EHP94866.1 hypothetical protein MetexDRAFT_0211 [Methylorubrum extorquens DSM 13060]